MADRSTVLTPAGDAAWVYDPRHNEIDFVSTPDATLQTYSLDQAAFTRTLALGGTPGTLAISADGQTLIVGNAATVSSAGQAFLAFTRVNLSTSAIDQVRAPALVPSEGVLHLATDSGGAVVFNATAAGDKAYFTFSAAAASPVVQDDAAFNGLMRPLPVIGPFGYLLTSPDHRFLLLQDSGGAPSGLVLYDTASAAVVAELDAFHRVQGFQAGLGDVTNSGMVVDVTYNSITVFDSHLQVVKDLSSLQNTEIVGAVFSQDARELFLWEGAQKTVFVYDTQTWARVASLPTATGAQFNSPHPHGLQIVDHGTMLALGDGAGHVELIDLTARLGLGAGPPPSADPGLPAPPPSLGSAPSVTVAGNMDTAHLSDLLPAVISQADDLGFAASGPGGLNIALSGGGLTYAGNQLVGGSINHVDFTDVQGGLQTLKFSATVVAVPAGLFEPWLISDQTQDAFQTILAHDDRIAGGVNADLIHGYAGNDLIWGAGGSDTIFGGLGNDVIYATQPADLHNALGAPGPTYLRGDEGDDYIVGGPGFDDINGNMGNDVESGGLGNDWVVGGKDNDLLFGDEGDDIVYGNLGNDTCVGGVGNDLIRGGQANDVLYGGAGNDWLSGDRGDDTLSGGAGADTFHTFSGAGLDQVLDFSFAEGDRVQLDPGTAYTLSQVGADTVIDMGGGDRMVLVGVQLSSLAPGWIFGA